ncbi:secreted RxLR effector protein 161-like [Lathyrus oleraceus]|uniref:secreted RxLR effector protein 161-like n=1 Tax=Pisum sativum TaxID=3888 RepID=UPI0021CE7571|nr:secreted RxLR effector protein 161-like [Pisum sativum]
MDNCKAMSTPMGSGTYVDQDKSGISIDITKYRANPKESHLTAVKRIMKYLKGTTNVGLWYPKGSICNLVGYSDADYAGCKTDRKSTSGTCHILENALV